jgi:hypothetical protein
VVTTGIQFLDDFFLHDFRKLLPDALLIAGVIWRFVRP